jgi:hypothetical protein
MSIFLLDEVGGCGCGCGSGGCGCGGCGWSSLGLEPIGNYFWEVRVLIRPFAFSSI